MIGEGALRMRNKVIAGKLQRAMGLFHHIVQVWLAGRPLLWPLWRCFIMHPSKLESEQTKPCTRENYKNLQDTEIEATRANLNNLCNEGIEHMVVTVAGQGATVP